MVYLFQVTFVTQQMEAFDGLSSETVEHAIQAYPKLRVTLFPAAVSDSAQLDISVYQLLLGNAPFDPSRLFGWQATNHIAGEGTVNQLISRLSRKPTICFSNRSHKPSSTSTEDG